MALPAEVVDVADGFLRRVLMPSSSALLIAWLIAWRAGVEREPNGDTWPKCENVKMVKAVCTRASTT
jgi:hypothetical protein